MRQRHITEVLAILLSGQVACSTAAKVVESLHPDVLVGFWQAEKVFQAIARVASLRHSDEMILVTDVNQDLVEGRELKNQSFKQYWLDLVCPPECSPVISAHRLEELLNRLNEDRFRDLYHQTYNDDEAFILPIGDLVERMKQKRDLLAEAYSRISKEPVLKAVEVA